ncbi:Protein FAR-RED ELONGATED HYPOCOTYL [Arachis hypogaea]|nr:Protein FAR-RED ELONGATED HYPOCOTYL [Arachis hypogaea]
MDKVFFWLKLRELSKNLIQAKKGLLMLLDSDLPALKVDFLDLQNSKWCASNCVGNSLHNSGVQRQKRIKSWSSTPEMDPNLALNAQNSLIHIDGGIHENSESLNLVCGIPSRIQGLNDYDELQTRECWASLIQFVKQYDNCLGSREQAERESDAADFHTVIPCATKSSIEAQFQDVYTHQKFREVQAQFRGKANCITRLTNSALGYSVYEVGEQVSSSIFNKFVVTYDSVAAEVKCQCLLFESRGILCRHALSVLSFEQVSQVSPRYILERWSKKVKRRHTHIKSSHDEPLLELRSKRFDKLFFRSQNICKFASESEELTVILHRAYDNVMDEMESLKAKRKGTSSLSHEDANLESVNELQSPPRIRTRGRPKNRLSSKLDKQIANATKKKKTKGLSEINLFDAASVVHSNSSQYQGHVMNYQFRVPAAGDNSLGV